MQKPGGRTDVCTAAGLFCFYILSGYVNQFAYWTNRIDNLVIDNLSPDYFKLAKHKSIYLIDN